MSPEDSKGRLSACFADIGPGLLCLSAYFWTGESLDSYQNMGILHSIGSAVLAFGGAWLLEADFQNTPDKLRQLGWLDRVRGTCFAATEPTCKGRTIDYWVLDSRLAPGVFGTDLREDWPLRPHAPIYIDTCFKHLGEKDMALQKAKRLPACTTDRSSASAPAEDDDVIRSLVSPVEISQETLDHAWSVAAEDADQADHQTCNACKRFPGTFRHRACTCAFHQELRDKQRGKTAEPIDRGQLLATAGDALYDHGIQTLRLEDRLATPVPYTERWYTHSSTGQPTEVLYTGKAATDGSMVSSYPRRVTRSGWSRLRR